MKDFLLGVSLILAGCAPVPIASEPAAERRVVPVAEARNGDVTIFLTAEGCSLPTVKNLPYLAVWKEPAGVIKGCYDLRGEGRVVVIYFEDQMVVVLPIGIFSRSAAPPPTPKKKPVHSQVRML